MTFVTAPATSRYSQQSAARSQFGASAAAARRRLCLLNRGERGEADGAVKRAQATRACVCYFAVTALTERFCQNAKVCPVGAKRRMGSRILRLAA
jgi:hypothetical protein